MKVCILYYDGFCEFEVVFAAALFKDCFVAAALEDRIYISEENQRFLPETTIDKLNPGQIDLFIIPGGKPASLYDNQALKQFVLELDAQGKYIAGICGGAYLMAAYGILDGKRCTGGSSGLLGTDTIFTNCIVCNDDIVVDGNAVTATGQAYVDFSFELARLLNLYAHQDRFHEDYRWYKNIK